MFKRDIEFLFEIGTLRHFVRDWKRVLGMESASVTEHIFRVAFLALLIARGEKCADEEKILKMALMHDIPEIRTGDTGYVQAVYAKNDENRAIRDMLSETGFTDFADVLAEYNERKTMAAKIVKDADNLDVDFEIKELGERGSLFPGKAKRIRRFVRNTKLYTSTAKKMWDELQKSDPSAWHLKSNKWVQAKREGRRENAENRKKKKMVK